ncbi:MAG: LlaJI family restriction endonuclease, partial [Bacteroidales bacterium]|nr:LlaJI family restriction endonuclease [Bacteroidales bacterium]
MLILIEGYPYDLDQRVRGDLRLRDILEDVVSFSKVEREQKFKYVGYCYSRKAQDVVFFLPKVVLTGEQDSNKSSDTIFGAKPEDIIDFEAVDLQKKFTEEGYTHYKEFLSTLSIWIYRAISVYSEQYDGHVLRSKEHHTDSHGPKHRHNSLLDVIIAMMEFNKHNQDYLTFVARDLHSGNNKIQWNKTISKTQAVIQNGVPIYVSPVNKKKVVNFEEELLVIFYSILHYLKVQHGFHCEVNVNYEIIHPDRLKKVYIDKKFGAKRLKQIKYKYFSDKALKIWNLCLAFFDRSHEIALSLAQDYLLVTDFQLVFERMVDSLIVGEEAKKLPKALTEQKDGKLVDHLYVGQGLIEQTDETMKQTYYIGDSKYYKRDDKGGVSLDDGSIYKQYTYARNVIQWNMDLFLGITKGEGHPQLFDPLTEGYNPIPNFFISA